MEECMGMLLFVATFSITIPWRVTTEKVPSLSRDRNGFDVKTATTTTTTITTSRLLPPPHPIPSCAPPPLRVDNDNQVCSGRLTDRGLYHLSRVKSLTRLNVSQNFGITAAGVRHVGTLTRLRSLNLSSCNITPSSLDSLTGDRHIPSDFSYGLVCFCFLLLTKEKKDTNKLISSTDERFRGRSAMNIHSYGIG